MARVGSPIPAEAPAGRYVVVASDVCEPVKFVTNLLTSTAPPSTGALWCSSSELAWRCPPGGLVKAYPFDGAIRKRSAGGHVQAGATYRVFNRSSAADVDSQPPTEGLRSSI